MKTNINLFCAAALMSALCTGFVACNEPKDPEQQGVDVPFSVYSPGEETSGDVPLGLVVSPWIFSASTDESKILIFNSAEEFENYAWDYPEPYDLDQCPMPDVSSVDFSQKTLLLVGGCAFAGVSDIAIRSFQYFPSGKYKLKVELALSSLAVYTSIWCIPILTDKISGDSKIEISVEDNVPEELKNPKD